MVVVLLPREALGGGTIAARHHVLVDHCQRFEQRLCEVAGSLMVERWLPVAPPRPANSSHKQLTHRRTTVEVVAYRRWALIRPDSRPEATPKAPREGASQAGPWAGWTYRSVMGQSNTPVVEMDVRMRL